MLFVTLQVVVQVLDHTALEDPVDNEEVTLEINILDQKKTTGIDIKMLKDNGDICAPILIEIFNNYIKTGTFVDELNLANVSPIFKLLDSTDKDMFFNPFKIYF